MCSTGKLDTGTGANYFRDSSAPVSEGYKYGSSAISPATKAVSQAVWLVKPLAGSWQLAIAAIPTPHASMDVRRRQLQQRINPDRIAFQTAQSACAQARSAAAKYGALAPKFECRVLRVDPFDLQNAQVTFAFEVRPRDKLSQRQSGTNVSRYHSAGPDRHEVRFLFGTDETLSFELTSPSREFPSAQADAVYLQHGLQFDPSKWAAVRAEALLAQSQERSGRYRQETAGAIVLAVVTLIAMVFLWLIVRLAKAMFRRLRKTPELVLEMGLRKLRDLENDEAARFLLGLMSAEEVARIQQQMDRDRPAFAAQVDSRRGDLIDAFVAGKLSPVLEQAFRSTVLVAADTAPEVEVRLALRAITDPTFEQVQVQARDGRPSRMKKLWIWLTLPDTRSRPQSAEGALMLRPGDGESGDLVLDGRVTQVWGDRIQLDLGFSYGIGLGDVVQLSRDADREWLGCAVVESADEHISTARFEGDNPPAVGDRASISLSGEVL